MNKINKYKGYMIYLDVLGYKDIIYGYEDNPIDENNVVNKLRNLLVLFTDVKTYELKTFMNGLDFDRFHLKTFSDNIVFIYESEKIDKLTFLSICSFASYNLGELIKRGFMAKGSISYGEIEFNDNIIFGKTLVDGYLLEENHNEPSIVLSSNLEKLFNECEVKRSEYLSPFSFYWDDVRYGENEPFLNGINEMVNRLNKNSEVSDKIIAKYDWLINEYNTYFKYAIKYKLHKEIGNFYLEPLENICWPEDFTNK